MKEVQIQSWCDGEHVMKQPASREQEVSLTRNKRFTVDLCDDCYGKMVGPLESIIKEHGVPVTDGGPAKRSANPNRGMRPGHGPEKCPVNGCSHGSTTRSGLHQHMTAHHPGQKLADYETEAAKL